MIRAALAISALLASIYAAHAFGLGLGNRFGHMGGAGKGGAAAPVLTGGLLLEDNASFLLLEDNASQLCLEGGC